MREQIVCSQTVSERVKETQITNYLDWWKVKPAEHIIFTDGQCEV